jgi:hypothetical protein
MSLVSYPVNQLTTDLALEPRKGGDDQPVPFAVTIASPGVATFAADYFPVNGQRLTLSTTGALPTGLAVGTTYFVVSASTNTCQLSLTSGGAAINTSVSQSGVHTAHMNTGNIASAATVCPFKAGNTVLVYNGTAGSLVLQDSDDNTTFGTLATVPAVSYANVQLRKQYIKVSTSATLYLLGN